MHLNLEAFRDTEESCLFSDNVCWLDRCVCLFTNSIDDGKSFQSIDAYHFDLWLHEHEEPLKYFWVKRDSSKKEESFERSTNSSLPICTKLFVPKLFHSSLCVTEDRRRREVIRIVRYYLSWHDAELSTKIEHWPCLLNVLRHESNMNRTHARLFFIASRGQLNIRLIGFWTKFIFYLTKV